MDIGSIGQQRRAPAPSAIVAFALALVGPISIAASAGLAALIAIAAAGGLAAVRLRGEAWPRPAGDLLLLSAASFLYMAVSGLWALDGPPALWLALRLALLNLAGMLCLAWMRGLPSDQAEKWGRWIVGGILLAVVIAAVHQFGPEIGLPRLIKRGATILAILTWPAVAILLAGGRRGAAFGLALATLFPAIADAADTALLAWLTGGAIFALALWRPRIAVLVAVAGVAVTLLFAPLMASRVQAEDYFGRLGSSSLHRLAIWNFTADRIAENPVLGWGLDAARRIPGGNDLVSIGPDFPPQFPMPLHPHNASLQIWLELGLGGVLLGLAWLGAIARRLLAAATPLATAQATAALTSAAVIANLSYGIWQNWWLAGLWLAAAAVVLAGKAEPAGDAR